MTRAILVGIVLAHAAATAEAFLGPAAPVLAARRRFLPAQCRLPSMSLQGSEKVVVYAGEDREAEIGGEMQGRRNERQEAEGRASGLTSHA